MRARSGTLSLTLSMLSLVAASRLCLAPSPAEAQAASPAQATASGPASSGAATRLKLGSYMAGRVARSENDPGRAGAYYSDALKLDPDNLALLNNAFDMAVTDADWPAAITYAGRMVAAGTDNRMARVMLALAAFKRGAFDEAVVQFKGTEGNPVGELTSTLGRAWVMLAQGKAKDALDLLEQAKGNDGIQAFYRYHRALLADVAGQSAEARASYDRAGKGGDNKTLRFAMAFAQHLSHAGDAKAAQAVLQGQIDRTRGEGHPLVRDYLRRVQAGERLNLLVSTPSEGLSEVFFGLGEALMSEGGLGVGAVFLQQALYLEPKSPFALATLANVYEATKRYDLANAAYDRVPKGTPLDTSIEIRKALNLNSMDKLDEAKLVLDAIIEREPTNAQPLETLGAMMRGAKRYEESVAYYSRAIALSGKPDAKHWNLYYSRGMSYERTKRWPQAEADLQQALKLAPDRPEVLNYLGYSWVDLGKNLKQGMALIEKAVRLKPDDGYIVDSLGWAHFRQNNFKDAVRFLERAVELRPDDPVLNDHLGDAYWRAGREREARFQWLQSLSLKPEPDDREKIDAKVKSGLPPLAQLKPQRAVRQNAALPPAKKKIVRKQPANPVQ